MTHEKKGADSWETGSRNSAGMVTITQLGLFPRALHTWQLEGSVFEDTEVLRTTRMFWVTVVSWEDLGKTHFL